MELIVMGLLKMACTVRSFHSMDVKFGLLLSWNNID
jgi:hypothetical protein